jgi:glycine C-acetyltransferase
MFSTSLAPQVVGSTIKAMDIVENDHILRSKLWDNITYFKHQIELLGFSIGNSESAIIPIILKNDVLVKDACRMLHDRGVYVNPVLYPAVKKS